MNILSMIVVSMLVACQRQKSAPIAVPATNSEACQDLESFYKNNTTAPSDPPYGGTIFLASDIIVPNDDSSFVELTSKGQGERTMYDRRPADWVVLEAHLFDAKFGAETIVEIQVNPEFNEEEALQQAERYAFVIGQLPGFLFRDLETVWIHKGDYDFGGGNNNLLIHVGRGENYIADGILEETFIHEGTHTSVDSHHRDEELWLLAQQMDTVSISTYGEEFPQREDLAETMPLYLALRYRPDKLSEEMRSTIQTTIPNRIAYLDCQQFSMDILE